MDKYRKAVLAIVTYRDKVLLVKKRKVGWQFPQGGVEKNETEEEAILRELKEELLIDENQIDKITRSEHSRSFDWPIKLREKSGFLGQKQTAFFVQIKNPNITLADVGLEEFSWQTPENATKMLAFDDLREFSRKVFQDCKFLGG